MIRHDQIHEIREQCLESLMHKDRRVEVDARTLLELLRIAEKVRTPCGTIKSIRTAV